ITHDAQGSPTVVPLSGMGTAPAVQVSPTALNFGARPIGSVSPPQSVSLSNAGNAPMAVTGIAATGEFSQTNNCPGTLAPGAGCRIDVTFNPTGPGNRTGALMVSTDAAGSPHSVSLSGIGTGPALALSAAELSFAEQNYNTRSSAQSVTLTNSGTAPLALSSI